MNILTRLKRLGFRARPLITAADTKAPPSAAEEPIKVRIPRLQPSPGQPATSNGPAAPVYECAHRWPRLQWENDWITTPLGQRRHTLTFRCQCGALVSFVETLAPAAEQTESTSVKPDSTQFAPAWTFAPSGSPLTRGKAVPG